MQTSFGVSLVLVLFLSVGNACSSKSTEDENKGGNGGLLPGAGGSSSSGGTASQTGGSSAGTTPVGGGRNLGGSSTGGTTGSADDCANQPLECVDTKTITGCNPDTLMDETADCAELVQSLGPGLTSEGCQEVDGRSVCAYDYADMKCAEGAAAFTVCYNAATGMMEDMTSFYIDCFSDAQYNLADTGEPPQPYGAKMLIQCFTNHISDNTVDCNAAIDACFPSTGAGGAGGAGG